MTTQISDDKKTYKEVTTALIAKYAHMTSDNQAEFIRSAPYDLADMLTGFGIKASVDTEKLEALIQHEGISGGPRGYFTLTLGEVEVELLFNDIVSALFTPKVLFMFLVNYHRICALAEDIKGGLQPFMMGKHEYAGDIFYSDVHLKIEADFKNNPAKMLIHRLICDYLRNSNFYVHS